MPICCWSIRACCYRKPRPGNSRRHSRNETLRRDSPPAGDREGRGEERQRAHVVLRSGARGQQDAGQDRRREAVQSEGYGSADSHLRRKVAAPGKVRWLPLDVEEGLREVEEGREDARFRGDLIGGRGPGRERLSYAD